MMKKSGFKPEQAAAIEASASNGGQLMPPVMGAVAFLMADFLQISYAEVAIAALVAVAALLSGAVHPGRSGSGQGQYPACAGKPDSAHHHGRFQGLAFHIAVRRADLRRCFL